MRDPQSVSAHFNLGRTFAAMNDHAQAIREFESLLAGAPNDIEARYQLSLSYAAVNQKEKAMDQFDRAARMDHDSAHAGEMQKKLTEALRTP
jgi:tetratricopeptide (TPR) repeat protein